MSHPLLILPLMLAELPVTWPSPADDPRARCPKPAIAADKPMFNRLGDLPRPNHFSPCSAQATARSLSFKQEIGSGRWPSLAARGS